MSEVHQIEGKQSQLSKKELKLKPAKMSKRKKKLSEKYDQLTPEDFTDIRLLGHGAFGQVNLVRCTLNKQLYALKELNKEEIVRFDRIRHTLREKSLMNELTHSNIVRLEATFKTEEF
jgi:serine/threonine protein kinase